MRGGSAFRWGAPGAWSLHPPRIALAKRVFSPDPVEVAMAKKIIAAMPDGSGAVMIDGKMQDDATWKQAKVVVDLAKLVAAKDPDLAATYGFCPYGFLGFGISLDRINTTTPTQLPG